MSADREEAWNARGGTAGDGGSRRPAESNADEPAPPGSRAAAEPSAAEPSVPEPRPAPASEPEHVAGAARAPEPLAAAAPAAAAARETEPGAAAAAVRELETAAAAAPVSEPESGAAAAPAPGAPASRTARIRALRRRHTISVLALSCAVFALAAAAFAWTTTRSHDRADRAETQLRSVSRLLGAGDVHLATAPALAAYYSPTQTSILIAASSLPAPPHGQVYELWYTNDATTSPLAHFTTLPGVMTVTRPASGPATLLLTLEPTDGSPRPATPPIATLTLTG